MLVFVLFAKNEYSNKSLSLFAHPSSRLQVGLLQHLSSFGIPL